MRLKMAIVALALVAVACSGGESDQPTLAPGPTSPTTAATEAPVVPTTVTTTSATPTTAHPPGSSTAAPPPGSIVPIPETEGEDDFAVIWRELIDYHNWAFQNPELADPSLYLAEECECFAAAKQIIDEYLENGWRETSPGLTVHAVDVDIEASTFALMTVVDEHSPLVVVDSDGVIVRERDRRPKTFWDVRVRLFDEGWRIVEWFQRGAVGDAE